MTASLRCTVAAALFLAGGPPAKAADCPEPAVTGCWLPPFAEDPKYNDRPPGTDAEAGELPAAVSVSVLPDGRVLYFNGFEGDDRIDAPRLTGGIVPPDSNSRSRVLDLSAYLASGADPRTTAAWSAPDPEDGGAGDLFCSDLKQLPDGRVLAVGGTINYDLDGREWGNPPHRGEFEGIRDVRTFDGADDTWTRNADMHHPRWYPSLVSLPGAPTSMLVVSGLYRLIFNEDQSNIRETETYDPAADAWTDNGAGGSQSLPVYPRLHLMPNGKILYPAAGQTWNPFGQASDYETWRFMKWYDPETRTWADIGPATIGTRNTPFSILLPLRPDPETAEYREARILLGGGTLTSYPPMLHGLDLVEIVTWSADSPDSVTRASASALNIARWFPSGVLLPTGEVLAINGADRDQLVTPGDEIAVRETEVYDPATGEWTELAPSQRDRTYHNTAALLPDGSVLVGGHVPQPADYGQQHRNKPPGAHNFRDPSFEIFQPPYLFRGPRPEITAAAAVMPRGADFAITTPDAANGSLQVVLSRLPAVTHLQDADQRTVELPIVSRTPTSVSVRPAAQPSVLPEGHYYLFLIRDNGLGPTPSRAHVVRVEESPGNGDPGGDGGGGTVVERGSGGALGPAWGAGFLALLVALIWLGRRKNP